MDDGPRYAIYFVPAAQSALYRCGSAILGYDCYTGAALDFPPEVSENVPAWRELTAEPRRYGFHATLKAPFRLPQSRSESELIDALHRFADSGRAVPAIEIAVKLLGAFIALVPLEAAPALDALAASCTTAFDRFRAAPSERERARRIAAGLSQNQIENLDRFGYPYVFSEFRFHMTLTGKVAAPQRAATLAVLQACTKRMAADAPLAVDRLALVKQDSATAPFRVLGHSALRAPA